MPACRAWSRPSVPGSRGGSSGGAPRPCARRQCEDGGSCWGRIIRENDHHAPDAAHRARPDRGHRPGSDGRRRRTVRRPAAGGVPAIPTWTTTARTSSSARPSPPIPATTQRSVGRLLPPGSACFMRGTLLIDDYTGHREHEDRPDAAAADGPRLRVPPQYSTRAVTLAEKAVERHYNDAAPHVGLGAALGLYVWFGSSVEAERGIPAEWRAARSTIPTGACARPEPYRRRPRPRQLPVHAVGAARNGSIPREHHRLQGWKGGGPPAAGSGRSQ